MLTPPIHYSGEEIEVLSGLTTPLQSPLTLCVWMCQANVITWNILTHCLIVLFFVLLSELTIPFYSRRSGST